VAKGEASIGGPDRTTGKPNAYHRSRSAQERREVRIDSEVQAVDRRDQTTPPVKPECDRKKVKGGKKTAKQFGGGTRVRGKNGQETRESEKKKSRSRDGVGTERGARREVEAKETDSCL